MRPRTHTSIVSQIIRHINSSATFTGAELRVVVKAQPRDKNDHIVNSVLWRLKRLGNIEPIDKNGRVVKYQTLSKTQIDDYFSAYKINNQKYIIQ